MKTSRRARRMQRHHSLLKAPGLNLVSLMDIFTILVFFLLVNSAGPQHLPSQKDLRLPSVVSLQPPAESLVLAVTKDAVLLQGVKVGSWLDWQNPANSLVTELQKELAFNGQKITAGPDGGKPITLMADETVPYEVIEKMISLCQEADFRQIAFAATLKARDLGVP
jgi:biopolymer transport protein ExbD